MARRAHFIRRLAENKSCSANEPWASQCSNADHQSGRHSPIFCPLLLLAACSAGFSAAMDKGCFCNNSAMLPCVYRVAPALLVKPILPAKVDKDVHGSRVACGQCSP
eukprot:GHUV01030457.1.p1 GENE.GHUV01030457.1~~GHUV01030457.1.p1  ORF type:complete len:107 (+),score=19.01 GHUV01030457.1:377-697(+)